MTISLRFLADENFNGKVIAGLRAELPDLDMIRAQDTEMYSAPDPLLLEWAAGQARILLTHDAKRPLSNMRTSVLMPVCQCPV